MQHLSLILASIALLIAAVPLTAQDDTGTPLLISQRPDGELLGFGSFHEQPDTKTKDVWTLNGHGVLACRGEPKGYIYTQKDYTSFRLTLQWRWPTGSEPGSGGVLVRMTGEHKIWPKCLEAQINAPDAGDFWGLDGYRFAGPDDRRTELTHPQFGKLTNLKKTANAERPAGEWNDYEIVVDGDVVTLTINGQQVNRAEGCDVTAGKICLTSEGNPIEFRNLRITPIESAQE